MPPAWESDHVDFFHEPVMREEVLSWLIRDSNGVYIDGTVGGAGHAYAILERTQAKLIGIDCDAEALAAAEKKLAIFGSRKMLVKANFAELGLILKELQIEKVDGVILDLGVSSHQLDAALRGFSFSRQAPLDMRMDQNLKIRAYDVVNFSKQLELEKIFRAYGEEKMAARIAKAIIRARQSSPIETTVELAKLIVAVMPERMKSGKIHPATRVFQALRIAVNRELDCLVLGIQGAVAALSVGGRLGIISFHSLEDRIVKNTFRSLENPCDCPKDIPFCVCQKKPLVKILTSKAIAPSREEIQKNPRSRSAKLRVVERI